MATINELRARAELIAEEQQIGGNTAERVGEAFDMVADIIEAVAPGDEQAVLYNPQSPNEAQKAQARANIGAQETISDIADYVKVSAQTFTAAQKAQARENIGAEQAGDAVKNLAGSASDTETRIKAANNPNLQANIHLSGNNIYVNGIAGGIDLDNNGVNIKAGNSGYPNAKVKVNGQEVATKLYVDSKIDDRADPIELALATIEAVIPSQASAQNQLADKSFVNSSISSSTANFVGTFDSLAELQAVQNPTNNDYGFVIETDAVGNEYYDRYKYNGSSWLFEYKVESTPFTSAQWAAIQSGITSALVGKLSALPTNTELAAALDGKQNVISDLEAIRSGAAAGATAVQPATMNTALAGKQDTLTFDSTPTASSTNPVTSGGVKAGIDAETSRATAAEAELRDAYAALTQSDIVVVPDHTAVATPAANTIYREPGVTSYADWMYYGGAWFKMAEYSNAIDEEPTAGSENLVKSGGVYNVLHGAPRPYDLLQNATLVTGESINATTGEPSPNSNYSQYRINVTGYNRIYGSTGTYINAVNVAFYNGATPSSSTYMSEYTIKATVSGSLETFDAAIPQGCVLAVVVFRKTLTPSVYTNARYGGIVEDIDGLETDLSSAESKIDIVEKELYIKLNAESNNNGYVIYRDGTLYTNSYVTSYGVSGFIPTHGASQLTIYNGVAQPNNTAYATFAFYGDASESAFISKYTGTLSTDVTGTFEIPQGVNFIRFTLKDYGTPAVIGFSGVVDGIMASIEDLNIAPQIVNLQLPIKQPTEALNILLIGTSWGVDIISALSAIGKNIGLTINTGDMYKSGGTISQYLDDIENDGRNTFYYHEDGETISSSGKTVIDAIQYKNWDVILLMEGATYSQDEQIGINTDFVKFLEYIHLNATNPRVTYGLLSTWTNKDAQGKQATSFERCNHLRKQTGINNIIPVGSALQYLRATSLNDGNDLYRDALHLNYGIGRFTASCALYYAICYPIFGVGLDNCTITGNWTEAGGTETYPTIDVSDTNRPTCIECAKKANANIFFLPDTVESL